MTHTVSAVSHDLLSPAQLLMFMVKVRCLVGGWENHCGVNGISVECDKLDQNTIQSNLMDTSMVRIKGD